MALDCGLGYTKVAAASRGSTVYLALCRVLAALAPFDGHLLGGLAAAGSLTPDQPGQGVAPMSEPDAALFGVARRYALDLMKTSRALYGGIRCLANTTSCGGDAGDVEVALHYLVRDFLYFRAALRGLDDPLAPIWPVDRALTRVREDGPFCCDWYGRRFLNAHRAAEYIAARLRLSLPVGLLRELDTCSFWEGAPEGDPLAPLEEPLQGEALALLEALARWRKEICELVLSVPEPPDIATDIRWENLQARERFAHLVECPGAAKPQDDHQQETDAEEAIRLQAVALIVGTKWPLDKVAKQIGKSRQWLYRNAQGAIDTRNSGKADLPRGWKVNGTIEAPDE
jgi:hypothetical protein